MSAGAARYSVTVSQALGQSVAVNDGIAVVTPLRGATVLEVWTFSTARDAQRAQHTLEGARAPLSSVDDLAVVSWPGERSSPLIWQVPGRGSQRELSGAFWGLLFGLVFLLPRSRTAEVELEPAVADGCLSHLGIDDAFVLSVRQRVGPETSALFALRSHTRPGTWPLPTLGNRHPTVVAVLNEEQDRRLRAGFADPDV